MRILIANCAVLEFSLNYKAFYKQYFFLHGFPLDGVCLRMMPDNSDKVSTVQLFGTNLSHSSTSVYYIDHLCMQEDHLS